MKYRPRIYYSDEQKAIMWDRWKKGDSLHDIARLFDRNHSSVGRILSLTGGIRPPQRIRSHLALSLSEREEISRECNNTIFYFYAYFIGINSTIPFKFCHDITL